MWYLRKACQAMKRQPIFISDSYQDYIVDEIERCDHVEYEGQVYNDDE